MEFSKYLVVNSLLSLHVIEQNDVPFSADKKEFLYTAALRLNTEHNVILPESLTNGKFRKFNHIDVVGLIFISFLKPMAVILLLISVFYNQINCCMLTNTDIFSEMFRLGRCAKSIIRFECQDSLRMRTYNVLRAFGYTFHLEGSRFGSMQEKLICRYNKFKWIRCMF